MDNHKRWMDLILLIQQTIPAVISLLLTMVPYGIEKFATIEDHLSSRERKNEQKSIPGKFLAEVTAILIFGAMVLKGSPESGEPGGAGLLKTVKKWFMEPGRQWEYYVMIVVFLLLGLLWHLAKFMHAKEKLIKLLKAKRICNYFKLKEPGDIGRYSGFWNKKLKSKEPYYKYNGSYILKDSYAQVRLLYGLLCWFFWCMAGIYALFGEQIDREGGGKLVLTAICTIGFYFYECYSYYNGYTWEEYEARAAGVSGSAGVVIRADGPLRLTVYRETTLHDRSLDMGRGKALVKIFNASDDYRRRCIGKMWADLLNTHPEETDTDFMSAAIQLADHKSVYFAAPFYRDAGPYIFPFLGLELLENKKILVISGALEDGECLKAWLKEGIQSKYGYLEFWDVETMLEGVGTADIGIATMSEIAELAASEFADDFLKNVSVVLLLQPSFFLAFQPIMMPQILAKIRRSQEKITYIVCDMNIAGMVDMLSDTLKESIIFVKGAARSASAEFQVLDADCIDESNPFNDLELCCVNELWEALEEKRWLAPKIRWYGEQCVPIWDVRWKLGTYNKLTTADEENNLYSLLTSQLEFYETGSFIRREIRATSFVEDSIYNARELLRQYESRGYQESRTLVFSPDYLMRDFMLMDEKQRVNPITQIMPRFQNSFSNMAIAIAYRLTKGSISEKEFEWLLSYYNYSFDGILDWEKLIKKLNAHYERLTGHHETLAVNYFNRQGNRQRSWKNLYYVTDNAREAFLDWYERNIEVVCFQDEQLISRENALKSMPGGHIYQYYLPKQFIVVAGKYYQIEKIGEQNGQREVKLSRAAEFCTVRRYYRQCRDFSISNKQDCGYQTYSGGKVVSIRMVEADLTVRTEGFFCSKKFQEWDCSDFVKTEGIPQREYYKKKILVIQGNQDTICILAVFLKELFFTLFPNCWQLLSVAMTENSGLEGRVDRIGGESLGLEPEIYIIEDSPLDLGLLDTIGIWFIHILNILSRYLDWLNVDKESNKKWRMWWENLEKTSGKKFNFTKIKDML